MKTIATFFLLLLSGLAAMAQELPALLSTAGVTAHDGDGRSWLFVRWDTPRPDLIKGKTFAVYQKSGAPADPGVFERKALVAATDDPAVLAPLLQRGAALGETVLQRDDQIRQLLAWLAGKDAGMYQSTDKAVRDGEFQSMLATTSALTVPEALGMLLSRSRTDAETAQNLGQMGALYPSIGMAMGQAWAGLAGVADGQPVTVEIRDWNAATQSSVSVLGRVTLTAGPGEALPAAAVPVQVPENNPKGDLNIKLRWAMPDILKQKALLTRGFNVWRLAEDTAIANGWDLATPGLTTLKASAVRANTAVAFAHKLYGTAPGAPDLADNFAADPATFFFADDNNRFKNGVPFDDGETFYYFVTPRDLLGRDGFPSPGGKAIAARRIPPPIPDGLKVDNEYTYDPGTNDGHQAFIISWKPNLNRAKTADLPADITTHYEIVRTLELTDLQDPARIATLVPVAIVPHVDGPAPLTVINQPPPPADADHHSTFCFAVRAVKQRPDGSLRVESGLSAPVYATIRDRTAPPTPIAWIELPCVHAAVRYLAAEQVPVAVVPEAGRQLEMVCERADDQVQWAQFQIRFQDNTVVELGQHVFHPDSPTVESTWIIPTSRINGVRLLRCRVGTFKGAVSRWVEVSEESSNIPATTGLRRIFQGGEVSPSTLNPTDPLPATVLAGTVSNLSGVQKAGPRAAKVFPSPFANGTEVLIQRQNPANGQWLYQTVATARGGEFIFSDPHDGSEFSQLGTYRALPWRPLEPEEICVPDYAPVFADGSSAASGTEIGVKLCDGAREFRVYRQINGGALSLAFQGTGDGTCDSTFRRDGLVSGNCSLKQYYVQTTNANGTPSALVPVGDAHCLPAPLPVPRLSTPEATGTPTAPKVRLRWFCPTPGVDRFAIYITENDKPPSSSNALLKKISNHNPLNPALPPPPAAAADASSMKLVTSALAKLKTFSFTEGYQTPRIGSPLFTQQGPVFTMELDVPANKTLKVSVAAVSGLGRTGKYSGVQEFIWEYRPPATTPMIPWPSRALPPVATFHPDIAAEMFAAATSPFTDSLSYPVNAGGNPDIDSYPAGVRIGRMTIGLEDVRNPVTEPGHLLAFVPQSSSPAFGKPSFNHAVFKENGKPGGETLLPCALYRQQVASTLFPAVSGDVVQVSPMVRSIEESAIVHEGLTGAAMTDPFIGVKAIGHTSPRFMDLYLLDTQPIVLGAAYKYFLVRFDPVTLEPERIIETNTIGL